MENIPQHIGFIMDGNGRWAKKRAMPRNFGHNQGASTFKKTINWCRELGVKCATFYAFSTENWRRPPDEINGIMELLRRYLKDIRKSADENIRIIILGDTEPFDEDIREELADIMQTSKDNTGFIVGIALNYGGRAEICNAVKKISEKCASGELSSDDITEELIEKNLYTSEMPPLDLVIRPSGEQRLSNFLIWQAAYAEFVFMDVLWPDFTKKDLEYAVGEYAGRNRRFGGI
ncbi:MAG: isoprenyl transferase [Lachnospiraceae bacterium]|nr:isoprenyl transferase [Ruminococcus sp.]MCM1275042.1 isoprenyl transferase [Lachnospiraceae bacterium]